MKSRILTGWTFTRALYLVIGSFIIVQGIVDKQWFVAILGGYFASMGLFAFGCAGGNCYGGSCVAEPEQKIKTTGNEIEFEKIETK